MTFEQELNAMRLETHKPAFRSIRYPSKRIDGAPHTRSPYEVYCREIREPIEHIEITETPAA